MRRAVLATTILALAFARPETYRENEEFQYSRSSSDDGSKSGFYGAQRGNMGGNYEKAHNMDSLAQNQMSTVVRQVDGELGSGADMKSGSVFNAGNSKGIYGSGQYDLSNLGGRNFEEGVKYDNSHSSSYSQSSGYHGNLFSANNARYRSQQSQSSQQTAGYGAGESLSYVGNQRVDDLQQSNNQEYGSQAANSYRYHSRSSNQGSSRYDQSITDSNAAVDSNLQGRYVSSPVRLYIRPGTRTTIPLTVQSYDATRLDSSSQATSEHDEQKYTENGMNSRPKHYESSYRYKKEWEKHDIQPLAIVPTDNPFPKHSDLYNSQNQQQDVQSYDDNSASRVYNANAKYSNSQQSKYQSGYKTGQNFAASSNAQTYTLNNQETKNAGEIENLVGDMNSKPKSYQSSYSYHKSWERHGDPYVIIPASDSISQTSQRLTAASNSLNKHTSRKHSSGYNYAHQEYAQDCDCDENGHIRVVRSNDNDEYQSTINQNQFDLGQQQQDKWENLEDLGQQTSKWDDLENVGQATQNGFDDLKEKQLHDEFSRHQLQNNLEDLGQQTQNKWDNLEDLTQQSENNLESLNQEKVFKVHNSANLEQEVQNNWNQIEESQQQTQNHDEYLVQTGQQSQNQWNNLEPLNHQSQDNLDTQDLGQQEQNKWDQLENLSQQSQINWNLDNINQHTERDLEQQRETYNTNLQHYIQNHSSFNSWDSELTPHQHTEISVQEETSVNNNIYKNFWDQFELGNQNSQSYVETYSPQDTNKSNIDTYFGSQFNNSPNNEGSPLNNLWNKLDNFDGFSQTGYLHNSNFFNTQETSNHYHSKHEWNIIHNTDQQIVSPSDFNHHEIQSDVSTNKNNTKEIKNLSVEKNLKVNNDTKLFKADNTPKNPNLHPVDLGRGDIDSEDTSTESTSSSNSLDKLLEDIPSNTKKDKSTDEIEFLSLKKIENEVEVSPKEDSELKVIGLNQNESNSDIQKQGNTNKYLRLNQINTSTSRTTDTHIYRNKLESLPVNSIPQRKENENIQSKDFIKIVDAPEELEEQNVYQQFHNINQNRYHNSEDQTLIFIDQNKNNNEINKLETSPQTYIPQREITDNVQQLQDSYNLINIQEQLEHTNITQHNQNNHDAEEQMLENLDQNIEDTQQFEPIDNFMNQHNQEQKLQDLDNFPPDNEFQDQKNIEEPQIQKSWGEDRNNQLIFKEPEHTHRVSKLESVQNYEIIKPIEVTEKPSFWKSVGKKFSSAKESVVSWFRS